MQSEPQIINVPSISRAREENFETGQVLTISGGHFIHDIYTAFVAPLLPLIIAKLSISLTLAGSLTAFLQLPGLLNPFIGYLADKIGLRFLVILAPAVTATLISMMGFAPSYLALAAILLATGVSVAAFHAPAPAMIAEVSHKKVGQGMSLFMAGGELGRTLGPLLAVWAVSVWTLDGIYRLMVLGWAASLVLFIRFRNIPTPVTTGVSLRTAVPALKALFLPLLFVTFFRNFLVAGLSVYLPTFMNMEGASLMLAGGALSIYQLAGAVGALSSGALSDRLGRKPVLVGSAVVATAVFLLFLNMQGWLQIPLLLILGFANLCSAPVLMAIVQEYLPEHRSVGNGLYMFMAFLMQLLTILLVGLMGDIFDLRTSFFWSGLISLLAIPAILALPVHDTGRQREG